MMPPKGLIRIYRIPLLKTVLGTWTTNIYIVSSVLLRIVAYLRPRKKNLQIVSIHSNLYVTGIIYHKYWFNPNISDCLECILWVHFDPIRVMTHHWWLTLEWDESGRELYAWVQYVNTTLLLGVRLKWKMCNNRFVWVTTITTDSSHVTYYILRNDVGG